MQDDGNLVIYKSDGTSVWSSGTGGNTGATFRIQNDRNLIVAASNNDLLWTSNTYTNARKLSKVGNNTATLVHHERTRRLSSREDRHLKTTIQDDQHRRLYDANYNIMPYNHDAATGPYYGVSFVKVWSMPRVTAITGCCTDPNECRGDQINSDLPQTCSNFEQLACRPTEAPSVSAVPSFMPSLSPSDQPSLSEMPSFGPSETASPSFVPSISGLPSFSPSETASPSLSPSISEMPSFSPSETASPSFVPSISEAPSFVPSISIVPSLSLEPSPLPTLSPTSQPTFSPTYQPTSSPTALPTVSPTVSCDLFPMHVLLRTYSILY